MHHFRGMAASIGKVDGQSNCLRIRSIEIDLAQVDTFTREDGWRCYPQSRCVDRYVPPKVRNMSQQDLHGQIAAWR